MRHRSNARRPAALARTVAAGTLVLVATAGCADAAPGAGSYPVATPQTQVLATPTASAGGYQLVAAGDPVRVVLPGADVTAQVSGPDVEVPTPAPGQPLSAVSAPGVLTVTFTATSGHLDVAAAGFLGLDEKQDPEALTADAPSVTVEPGHPATLHLSSTFATGHTTLTWQPLGTPLVTWDFVVEID
ncbi:hypothetical protein OG218_09060 [Kineococcus sp. NBC_00420]|uniref:hypothetical protein n=1 Tax=Kineococcus sp. NBC_00420 TaxID=2903564 RepID=UPI002E1B0B15